jgi:hypothetical protein
MGPVHLVDFTHIIGLSPNWIGKPIWGNDLTGHLALKVLAWPG